MVVAMTNYMKIEDQANNSTYLEVDEQDLHSKVVSSSFYCIIGRQ